MPNNKNEETFTPKFLQEALSVERVPIYGREKGPFGTTGPERLVVTIEYLGVGDTSKITLAEVHGMLLKKLGNSL